MRLRHLSAVLLSALSVASCLDALGIRTMTETRCGPLADPHPGCPDCLAASCCAEAAACDADPKCRELEACLAACPLDGPNCRRTCELASPESVGLASAVALDACKRQACTKPCLGAGFDDLAVDPACLGCFVPCFGEFGLACVEEGVCERLSVCASSAANPSERFACFAPGGGDLSPAVEQLLDCTLNCAPTCGAANDFACVGEYVWPVSGPEMVPYTVELWDFFSSPVPDAEVLACGTGFCGTCDAAHAIDGGTTDASGKVTFPLPRSWLGCLHVAKPGFVTLLAYPGVPPNTALSGYFTRLAPPELANALIPPLGAPFDPTKGALYAHQHDCRFDIGVDVRFESEGGGTSWGYGDNFQPGLTSGFQGLRGNLDPGSHWVRGLLPATDEEVSFETVVVLANTVTAVELFPKRL